MAKTKVDFDTVKKIGLALPGVEESTAYSMPALKIRGELMACVPSHRSADPDSLVVRVGFDDRSSLLAENPDVYYVTDHYVGYSGVLVRLSRVDQGVLKDLLRMAHKFASGIACSRSRAPNKRKPQSRK